MSAINYTYFATIGAVETQVHPSGDWSLKVTKAEEDFPYCKDYRIKFEGDFIFSGDDYLLLIDAGCCDKIDLKIQCNGVDYWFGYFPFPYQFDVDEDRCEISGTPKPLDKYYFYDRYADLKKENWASDTFTYQSDFPNAPGTDTWSACLPCEPLFDIMNRIGTAPPLWGATYGVTMKSTFFNNDIFPDLTNPYPSGPGAINYVTGFANKLNHVVMAMADEVCTLGGTAGTWADLSWNELMEIIHNTFNTWWYIDEQGDVRVEHIYFWELYFIPPSYNLRSTGANPIDDGRWIVNTSKYDYRIEEMPIKETWNWSDTMSDVGITFDPEIINYYSCYVPGAKGYNKEYSLSNLITDLEYIAPGINNFAGGAVCANLSSSDYMFIECLPFADVPVGYTPTACTYCAWFSTYLGDGLGNPHVNAHLSPINLIVNYWMHDRPLWEGYMETLGTDVNFESTWKNLRQRELCFPVCCDNEAEVILDGNVGTDPQYLYEFGINFNEAITTQYGDGELYTGTIKDGMLCLQLIFEDDDCEETPTEWSDASEL